MKKVRTHYLVLLVLFTALLGCENSNIFSWSHEKGGDDSVEALAVDARSALIDGDYDEAIELYNKILEKDPDSSDALYGLAAAELKEAGLDIADLLPKFLNEENTSSSISVPGASQVSASDVENLLPALDFKKIEEGTRKAIAALEEIASGRADGTIPADDIDVNLNLAIAKVLHAAAFLLNKYNVDIKEDFSVTNINLISQADKDIVIAEIESALDNNLYVITRLTDIDIDEIRREFDRFKAEFVN